ncbi:Pal1 cell morphology protein-domain-containing protein [Cryomyces antarcticus]|uniref:Pal1 cell morphology protein n=1 Tax=Cryomyces antarcticus TaxID=329879 RepID=A0ABR0M966_9PEZI|nr:hypothetical protein LTR16_000295 [Cryomyces antarcticus]
MSLAQPIELPDRRPSPALTLNLSSNNPFRNRTSPLPSPSPRSATFAPNNRPVSRNPFLDPFADSNSVQAPITSSSGAMGDAQNGSKSNSAAELFSNLSLSNKPAPKESNRSMQPPPPRTGTLPVQPHRPSHPQEEAQRLRNGNIAPPRPKDPGELDIFASPPKTENRRPRRSSESSVHEKSAADDERRRRERRHREREARHKDGRPRDSRPPKTKKPGGLDLIDKLDVTGIYGQGLFHHDGPFDACNPHRNRKKDSRAPMQAFPVGSANNALGGSGPVNKSINVDQFHGRGVEGFTDYATSGVEETRKRPSVERAISFNPKDRVEPVHGEESIGLGTSTFLEGAPASRTAIQRRESDNEASAFGSSLTRKRSLAQRIRGISQPRRGWEGVGAQRITPPDARYHYGGTTSPDSDPQATNGPQSAGGRYKTYEQNPFFDDYDDAYEKKGASIKIAETENHQGGRARAPSSPMGRHNALERRITTDSIPEGQQQKSSGGFLSRVKSLKGGRRSRPEQRIL